MINKILVVDDEESLRFVLRKGLEKAGYRVETAPDAETAFKLIHTDAGFDLVFLDIFLPGVSGLTAIDRIKNMRPDLPVVIMTAQATMQNAIEAMQKGAYDYLTKPFDIEEVYLLVSKTAELKSLREKVHELENRPEQGSKTAQEAIVGKSAPMQAVFKQIGKIAPSDLTVLITGESGTGKELFAKALHSNSKRRDKPLVSVNCAAIPEGLLESELFGHEKGAFTGAVARKPGKFELADRGTIFLDEIGDMSLDLQAKMLRVLQEREFYRVGGNSPVRSDVRIIAATNRNIEELVRDGKYRDDLYHRLNVLTLRLPPLRDRKGDIAELARYFTEKIRAEAGFEMKTLTADSIAVLESHSWPGNVRELENAVKRGVVLAPGQFITPDLLPPEIVPQEYRPQTRAAIRDHVASRLAMFKLNPPPKGAVHKTLLGEVEKILIELVLQETGGNQLQAAKILGINRNTLAKRIKELEG